MEERNEKMITVPADALGNVLKLLSIIKDNLHLKNKDKTLYELDLSECDEDTIHGIYEWADNSSGGDIQ